MALSQEQRLRLQALEAKRVKAHAAHHGWIGELPASGEFTSLISWEDRQRLRAIIRRVQLAHLPSEQLTDKECDRLIDAWGPEVAAAVCRDGRAAGYCE